MDSYSITKIHQNTNKLISMDFFTKWGRIRIMRKSYATPNKVSIKFG